MIFKIKIPVEDACLYLKFGDISSICVQGDDVVIQLIQRPYYTDLQQDGVADLVEYFKQGAAATAKWIADGKSTSEK